MAVELKEVYPALSARLADVVARIDANDREIEKVNTWARPDGAEGLAGAEMVARGIKGFNYGLTNIPRITRDLRLPSFEEKRARSVRVAAVVVAPRKRTLPTAFA